MSTHLPPSPAPAANSPVAFRPDVEGMRALAVLLVLVYHAGLGPFHGGLIGVDVFFVVSGFLITSLLLRERERSGTISLGNFWARRIRRLLPASTLVVVSTVIAARWMVPPVFVERVGRDALGAVGFVVNIVFGHRANDYLGGQMAEVAPSPLLHFWSLAVEEQFYLVWPFLLWGLARLGARTRAVALAVAVLGTASLIACLVLTRTSPVWAFYLLPTRAWELLAGAALAVVGVSVARLPAAVRAAAGWAGLGGIVLASLVISDNTSFPGYAALLPVLSTVALIASGVEPARWAPARLLSVRPLQWVGGRSYAIYLWHWPALVLAESHWGELDAPQRVAVVAVSLVIAALAHALVEDPVRHARWLALRPIRSYSLGVSMVAVGLVAAVVTINSERSVVGEGEAAAPTLVPSVASTTTTTTTGSTPPTSGPDPSAPATTEAPEASLEDLVERIRPLISEAVENDIVPSNITPPLSANSAELPVPYADDCLLGNRETDAKACVYGDPNASTSVAILGDSHAAQWQPALASIAERRNLRIVFHGKRRCSANAYQYRSDPASIRRECVKWRANALDALAADPVDLVILTSLRFAILDGLTPDRIAEWQAGYQAPLERLAGTGARLLVLGDPPLPEGWPGACLSKRLKSATACVIDRSAGEPADIIEAERSAARSTGATYVPTGDWFCIEGRCAVLIGNINLYRDSNHISIPASLFFAPLLEAAIVESLAGPQRPANG